MHTMLKETVECGVLSLHSVGSYRAHRGRMLAVTFSIRLICKVCGRNMVHGLCDVFPQDSRLNFCLGTTMSSTASNIGQCTPKMSARHDFPNSIALVYTNQVFCAHMQSRLPHTLSVSLFRHVIHLLLTPTTISHNTKRRKHKPSALQYSTHHAGCCSTRLFYNVKLKLSNCHLADPGYSGPVSRLDNEPSHERAPRNPICTSRRVASVERALYVAHRGYNSSTPP